jgi:hypothetical protein
MTDTTTPTTPDTGNQDQAKNGFFINNGTLSGWFTTPDGDIYDIRKMEPREVTDPRSGEVSTIWGGYATARDRDLELSRLSRRLFGLSQAASAAGSSRLA